jgi:hypothetical protein
MQVGIIYCIEENQQDNTWNNHHQLMPSTYCDLNT